jgi:alpha-D-ribose 1-methylphosphonate 5-triphosphate synthase subunit PhnI
MYVAVKGGEAAILASWKRLAEARRGDPAVAELELAQIREQLGLAVDRVMCEGSCYDPDLAALAVKQAQGDLVEAIFLVRAYRTTLPRLAASLPVDTARMHLERRISATFKDLPGGQILGPTYDYTQRLLDFALAAQGEHASLEPAAAPSSPAPRVVDSVQARLFDLLRGLAGRLGLAAIVVTHDLAVARLLAHRMIVMRGGCVVECGLTDQVLDDPQHPYSQLLVSSC